jgi:hypothetical protein
MNIESHINLLARKICKRPRTTYVEDWYAVKEMLTHFVEQNATLPKISKVHPVELKPCPWCGREATLTNVMMSNYMFRIGCHNENCGVRPSSDYYGSRENPMTAQEVIDAWNNRANAQSCEWTQPHDFPDVDTACGHHVNLQPESAADHTKESYMGKGKAWKFCMFCGHLIKLRSL